MKKLYDHKVTEAWVNDESGSWNRNSGVRSYASVVGHAIDKISVVSIATFDGTIIQVNKNFENISGYKSSELIGKNYSILNSTYHSRRFWQDMRDTLARGIPWHHEIRNRAKDGTIFWVDTSIVPVLDDDGRVRECLSIQNEITDPKNTNEGLSLNEETMAFAVDAVEVGIWEWHVETNEFVYNDHMRKHLGWLDSSKKISCDDFCKRLHPDDVVKFSEMRDAALNGQSKYKNEYRIVVDDDGGINHISTKGIVVRDTNGRPIKIIGASLNVTDLKKKEEELIRKQGLLDLAIEAGEIGIYSWGGVGNQAVTNKYMDLHFGMPLGGITYNEFLNVVHPEDQEHLQRAVEESFLNQKKFDVEYRLLFEDGSERHIAAKGNVICENGVVKEMVGIALNISKQKILEEELKTKNEMLNMAIEAGQIGVFDWEVETRKTTWNSLMHQHLGLSVEEFDETDESFIRQVHPDDRESIFKAVEKSIQQGKPVDLEYRVLLADKTIRYIKCRGILINDGNKRKKIVGICLNITKLKKVEEQLHLKQEVLNLAIRAGEIGVFSWDIKRGMLSGNKYIAKHYGFARNKVEGTFQEFMSILHPQDVGKITEITEANFESKVKYEIDYRVILKDGKTYHMASSGILSRDAEGNPERMVGVVLNVSKQKELEVTLRESEKKFRSAMYDSAIGMALIAIDGRFLEVNRALLDILGYEEAELVKINIQSVTHQDDLTNDVDYVQQLASVETAPHTFEKRYLRKNGNIIWCQLNGSMVKNDAGEFLYFVAQIQDITLRKQIDEKLQEHNQKLEAVNNELESFSYSVSHDLRAPLRIINGYVDILREDFSEKLNDEGKQVLETIIYNADKMGHLIDDLLEFSRMNRKGIEKNVIGIDTMVNGIISELIGFEGGRKIDIKIGTLHTVLADIQMLRQVWFNLIQNAIKYTRKNDVARIEIDSYKEQGSICFSIRDNGVGFNMKYVHKLFEVFQRLHSATEFEGTGVGLAIVKRIIDRHGGRIWVNSEENKGTTFYFAIPDDVGK